MSGRPKPATSAGAFPGAFPVARQAHWEQLQGERFPIRLFEAGATAVVGSVRRDGELQISVLGTKGRVYKNVLLYDIATGIFEIADVHAWTGMLRRHRGSAAWLAALSWVCALAVRVLMLAASALLAMLNSLAFFGVIGLGLVGLGLMALLGYLILYIAMEVAVVAAPFALLALVVERVERRINARQSQRVLDQVGAALSAHRLRSALAA